MITENLFALKINKLTQAQYDKELAAGNIKDDELYITPDEINRKLVISSVEPIDENVQIWANPYDEDFNYLPEVKDNVVNNDDVWSSNKIDVEINNIQTVVNNISFENLNTFLFNLIYPVGSIYMTVNNVNPSTLFGGTWTAWASGRIPVGVNSSDSNFSSVELTGGEKGHTLTISELASHTHSVSEHAHGLNSHTHSIPAHAHGLNSHTHSVTAHAHGLNSHTHSIPALSGTAASNGAHTHKYGYRSGRIKTGTARDVITASTSSTTYATTSAGAHTHTVSINANTTGGPSTTTANSSALTSGAASGNTANNTAYNSDGSTGNTANSSELTSGANGSGNPHNNLQPYITCYMWKRTE